jgi:large subunit ribosomal protein L18
MKTDSYKKAAKRRQYHVRKKAAGTSDRPRLSVFRSNRNIYAQIIDDVAGVTLVSSGSGLKALKEKVPNGGNRKAAAVIGEAIAKEAISVGIKCVCFDRGSYKYHGRVKALAEAARKTGLDF